MKTQAISVFILIEQLNDHYTWRLLFLHTWVLKTVLCTWRTLASLLCACMSLLLFASYAS